MGIGIKRKLERKSRNIGQEDSPIKAGEIMFLNVLKSDRVSLHIFSKHLKASKIH